jgi:DNA-binding transcriptional ArsR family regulator
MRTIQLDRSTLPNSAKFVLFLLKLRGSMTTSQLAKETEMYPRTITFALKLLKDKGIIAREEQKPRTKRGDPKPDKRCVLYNICTIQAGIEV